MADSAPPVYLCADCVDAVRQSKADLLLFELTQPARDVQLYCERKVLFPFVTTRLDST